MARTNAPKKVNFKLSRGIRMHGKPIPAYKEKTTGTGDKAKTERTYTVISIRETLAKELAAASKGEITNDKPNVNVAEPVDDDGLDAAFGAENSED